MNEWDGTERRKDNIDMSKKLDSLCQRIDEMILPCIHKHDICLYGEKGTNGMSKDVNDVKAGLIMLRYVGYVLSVIFTLAIAVIAIFKK
jgi:hypothetical protein